MGEKTISSNDLPAGWEQIHLKDICEIILGQSPPSETYNTIGKGLPFFQGKAEFTELHPIAQKWCSIPGKIAEQSDILLSVRAPVGSTNIADRKCCIGRGLAALRFNNHKLLFYYLRLIEKELDKKGTGSTFKAISGDVVRNIDFPLPPFPEQHRIVAKIEELFSELDKGVEALKTAQQQLKVYRQAVLKWAFEDLKEEKEVGDITSEHSIGLVRSNDEQNEKGLGIPYIKMNNVDLNGNIDFSKVVFVEVSIAEAEKYSLKKGDILINTRNSVELVGKTGIVREENPNCVFNNNLLRIRTKSEYNPRFIGYQLISPWLRKQMTKEKKATTNVCALYQRDIFPLKVKLANLQEQDVIVQEIETRLSVADKLEETITQSLAAFQKHKDEEREDRREGNNLLIHRTEQKGGQTVVINMDVGHDSYVLCGSALASRDLMAKFGCDSGLVIRDNTSFSNAVATPIPGFIGGLEGVCSYSKMKILMKDLGHLPFQPLGMPPNSAEQLPPEIMQIAQEIATTDVYFTKEQKYAPQLEYRFIWRSASPIADFITVRVPDARQFCDRFTDFDA